MNSISLNNSVTDFRSFQAVHKPPCVRKVIKILGLFFFFAHLLKTANAFLEKQDCELKNGGEKHCLIDGTVELFHGFLTPQEAQSTVDFFTKHLSYVEKSHFGRTDQKELNLVQVSKQLGFTRSQKLDLFHYLQDDAIGLVFEKLCAFLQRKMAFSSYEEACSHIEHFSITHYSKFQYFDPHKDQSFSIRKKNPRVASIIVYLNQVIKGGETAFLNFSPREEIGIREPLASEEEASMLKISPEPGKLVFFQYDDEGPLHQALPVFRGDKYIILAFVKKHLDETKSFVEVDDDIAWL